MTFGQGAAGIGGLHDPVGDLRRVADAVVGQDPSTLTDAELGTDLVRLRAQMDRLEAAFAARVQAAERRGIGLGDGARTTAAWISWKTGLPRPAVARVRRQADLVEVLADTGAAWRAGEITTTAVETIGAARVPGHDEQLAAVEAEWLDWARRGDHRSLRILARHFARCARADGTLPSSPDGLTLVEVGDRHELRADLSDAAAQTVHDALASFTRPPAPDDGTTLAERRAEALVRICEVALERGTDAAGARPVVSYMTVERRAGDEPGPITFATFAGVIAPGERDRVLCDATVARLTADASGTPVDVGRSTSVWSTGERRKIVARDRHCQWPGCDLPAPWCDAHHFVHWEHGGPTTSANGLLLCRRHHTFLHAHPRWSFTFTGQRFRVYRPDGTELHRDPWAGVDRAA